MNLFKNPKSYAEDCYRCGSTVRNIAAESQRYPHVPAEFWLDAMRELMRLEAVNDVGARGVEHRRLLAA